MTAEYYASELARFSRFLKNYDGNSLVKIGSGGLPWDHAWTETIMKKWASADGWLQDFLEGYSLHFYTVDWNDKGSATQFTEKEWFKTLRMTMEMDTIIARHTAIMDRYDPQNRIGLFVDEWGTWLDVEPGTNPAFLYQQNSLRDALVAAVNFNIFHKHARRVKMANIAQMVNVLQAMILTRGKDIVLTPTYFAFKMYAVHQDAVSLPLDLQTIPYTQGEQSIPTLSATASRDRNGSIHISVVNLHPSKAQDVRCEIKGVKATTVTGEIITADAINAFNDFGKPVLVNLRSFEGARVKGNVLTTTIPARAVVTLRLQ
jgi:alpha-N-arabinofuranosidase